MTAELATALNEPGQTGQRITEVLPDTAAQRAGLQAGDGITGINGQPLLSSRPQDSGDLVEAVRRLSVGSIVDLTVVRGTKSQDIKVTLEANPSEDPVPPTEKREDLGFTVRGISRLDRI